MITLQASTFKVFGGQNKRIPHIIQPYWLRSFTTHYSILFATRHVSKLYNMHYSLCMVFLHYTLYLVHIYTFISLEYL